MRLPFLFAIRYIFAKRTFSFITIVAFLSIIGIMVGVASLIIALSVFNGFQDLQEKQIIGFDPHIKIISKKGVKFELNPDIKSTLRLIPNIASISEMIEGKAAGISESNIQVFKVNGVPFENANYLSPIAKTMLLGGFHISEDGAPGLIIGGLLADRLKTLTGDSVILMSPKMIESSLRTYRRSSGTQFHINGIFRTNQQEYDNNNAFMNIDAARKLFSIKDGEVTSLNIRLYNIDKVEESKAKIISIIPSNLKTLTWHELNIDLYRVMRFERMSAFTVLSLIIVIALFNVLASLSMTVVEKRQDIAALMSMGCKKKLIRTIFILEGGIIGGVSSITGAILGILVTMGQVKYKWFSLDRTKFIVDAIPIRLDYNDVILVMSITFILTLISTIYPAKRASETNIIRSMRSE